METAAAVDYSVQYIPQRSLPDKAIDLVDVMPLTLAATPSDRCMQWNMKLKKKKLNKGPWPLKKIMKQLLNAKVRIEELGTNC